MGVGGGDGSAPFPFAWTRQRVYKQSKLWNAGFELHSVNEDEEVAEELLIFCTTYRAQP